MAGMAVRIVDVDVTDINRRIDRETLQRIGQIEAHYGHAGPAFVEALIAAQYHRKAVALRDHVLQLAQTIAGPNADSVHLRAAIPLALLRTAGELAERLKLLPDAPDVDGAICWAWERFRQSSDALALEPEDQALSNIRTWIAERWDVTIKPTQSETGINNRESIASYDDTTIYLPRPRLREAAGGVMKESAIAQILDRRHMLTRREDDYRRYVRYVPKYGKVDAYALSRVEPGRMALDHHAGILQLYDGGLSNRAH